MVTGQLCSISDESPAVRGTFLAIIFSLGLFLNVMLVFTISFSVTLRRVTFNLLLLQLFITCTLECMFNITASIFNVTILPRTTCDYASEATAFCRINSTLTQFVVTMHTMVLAALTVDRVFTLYSTGRKDDGASANNGRLDFAMRKIFPGASWLYAAILVAPVAACRDVVAIRPFSSRHLCGIVRPPHESGDPEDLIYPALLFALGGLLPWIVMTTAVTAIAYRVNAERRRQRQLEEVALQRNGHGNSSPLWTNSYDTSWSSILGGKSCWDDSRFYLILIILLILYVLLLVPHILSVHISLFTIVLTTPPDDFCRQAANSSSLIPVELMPVVTGVYDDIFMWCRYKFTIIAPIIVLVIHKEVRKKCEYFFSCCCCRDNNVAHIHDTSYMSKMTLQRNETKAKKKTEKKNMNGRRDSYGKVASYRTPVLFATSEGLHLRLVDVRLEDSAYPTKTDNGSTELVSEEPNFLCEFCDLAIITYTPIESITNSSTNFQQSFVGRGLKQPARFGQDAVAEKDLHLSDHHEREDLGQFFTSFRKEEEIVTGKTNRNKGKKKMVRFAKKTDEIPLTESGVWSAYEETGTT